jgi:hypothetical protein
MWNFKVDKACYQLNLSRTQKSEFEDTWNAAEQYYNNSVYRSRQWNPSILVSPTVSKRGFDNNIPDLIASQIAWIMSRPFEVQTEPLGDKGDMPRIITARTCEEFLHYYKSGPDFDVLLRDIITRMDCYNFCAVYDYWDERAKMPACRIFDHRDVFIDPLATAQPNMPGGPRWMAIGRMMHRDEVENRYGADKLNDLTSGRILTKDVSDQENEAYTAYSELYEVIEWFGIDETEETISEEETESIVLGELNILFDTGTVDIDEFVNHLKAVESGDKYMVERAATIDVSVRDINTAITLMAQAGFGEEAQLYLAWREAHLGLYDEEEPGGTRPKFRGGIYHAEFQFGTKEPLLEPAALEFPHYEIPISVFRSRIPTTPGIFGFGMMSQVLSLQSDIEKWEHCEYTFAQAQARKNIALNLDALDPGWVEQLGLKGILDTIQQGFQTIFTRGMAGKEAIHAVDYGNFSMDVRRIIDYKRYRISEIIGPTPVMRGQASGEMSGKQVEIRTESASMPVQDVLNLIESPIQKTFYRMNTNVIAYADLEKIEEISGSEAAQAMDYVRQTLPDYKCAVRVNLGNAFPNNREFMINFGLGLVQTGLIDPVEWGEKINSPFKIRAPQMPQGQVPPNTGSPPAPTQIQGAMT